MVASTIAGVERKTRGGEASFDGRVFSRVEGANAVPSFAEEGRVGPGGAREWALVDEHDITNRFRPGDGFDRRDILGRLVAMSQ